MKSEYQFSLQLYFSSNLLLNLGHRKGGSGFGNGNGKLANENQKIYIKDPFGQPRLPILSSLSPSHSGPTSVP